MMLQIKQELDKRIAVHKKIYPGVYADIARKFNVSRSYVSLVAKKLGYEIDKPLIRCNHCKSFYHPLDK